MVPEVLPAARMRPLFIENALRDNGGLRVSCDIAVRWWRAGVPSRMFVMENPTDNGPQYSPPDDLPVRLSTPQPRRIRRAFPFMFIGLFSEALRSDVIISGSEVGYGLILGWMVARLLGRPFVVLVQSELGQAIEAWSPARLRGLLRWVHRRVDLAECVSAGLRDSVRRNGLREDRISSFLVGIDTEDVVRRGAPPPMEQSLLASPMIAGTRLEPGRTDPSEPPARLLAVAAGRLSTQKGFDVLLRAHAKALADGADHRLMIIGEGDQRPALEAIIEEEGLGDSVLLAGYVRDPQPLLARADLFVLSSRYEGNGGLVLMEALAHGLPVIATDCPSGPRTVLEDGALGDLVPKDDPDALANALVHFVKEPSRLRELAKGGPRRAQSFEASAAAEKLLDEVRDLVTSS